MPPHHRMNHINVFLTHFNNCNFSKAQLVHSLMMVFHTKTCLSCFNINFNANLKLFFRLSNCASVGGKIVIIIKMHGIYVKMIDCLRQQHIAVITNPLIIALSLPVLNPHVYVTQQLWISCILEEPSA